MTLASGVESCPQCNNRDVGEVFFVDRLQRSEFKERHLKRQSSWTQLTDSLQQLLKDNGADWKEADAWDKWWRDVQPLTIDIGIKESQAIDLAERLSQEPPPKPEPDQKETTTEKHTEPEQTQSKASDDLVKWVESLPGGHWNVLGWKKFLASLGPGADESTLRKQRDDEIDKQFPAFYTVSVREDGTVWNSARLRVKRFTEVIDEKNVLSLVRVPEGTFMMGSERYFHEGPVRKVTVSEFYLGRFLVTQSQWQAVMHLPKVSVDLVPNPSYFQGPDLPVDSVTWTEASEFCARLANHSGRNYRLPSEAEWEYACRASSTTAFAFGETITPRVVNYDGAQAVSKASPAKIRSTTIRTGSLEAANKFGLHDMHGNLWEWCADEWHENYAGNSPLDSSAWITNAVPAYRTLRGGAWCNWADACRSSERMKGRADETERLYYIGFRIALSL
jgi:formylglycine-generating enzyme required for sulfatase activity